MGKELPCIGAHSPIGPLTLTLCPQALSHCCPPPPTLCRQAAGRQTELSALRAELHELRAEALAAGEQLPIQEWEAPQQQEEAELEGEVLERGGWGGGGAEGRDGEASDGEQACSSGGNGRGEGRSEGGRQDPDSEDLSPWSSPVKGAAVPRAGLVLVSPAGQAQAQLPPRPSPARAAQQEQRVRSPAAGAGKTQRPPATAGEAASWLHACARVLSLQPAYHKPLPA